MFYLSDGCLQEKSNVNLSSRTAFIKINTISAPGSSGWTFILLHAPLLFSLARKGHTKVQNN